MAFTLPKYLLDGTDTKGDVVLPSYLLDGTDTGNDTAVPPFQLNGTDTKGSFVLPPLQLNGTDVGNGTEMAEFVCAGTDVGNDAKLPTFACNGTDTGNDTKLPAFACNGTNTGNDTKLPAFACNGTDTKGCVVLPPLQLNGTDGTVGAWLPPFQLNGTDASVVTPLPEYVCAPSQGLPGSYKTAQYFGVVKTGAVAVGGTKWVTAQLCTKLAIGWKAKDVQRQLGVKTARGFVGSAGTKAITPLLRTKQMIGASPGIKAITGQYFRKTATGAVGATGIKVVTRGLAVCTKGGYAFLSGVSAKRLGLPQKRAFGIAGTSGQHLTVSMHSEKLALTSYDNFGFNSYCLFNGVPLAASAAGLYSLDGDTDDGTQIAATVAGGVSDFGTAKLKEMPLVYIGCESSGSLELSVITDKFRTRVYTVASDGLAGLRVNRVIVGKGVQARYWQFGVSNVGGCDFTLDNIEPKPAVLNRRIGGKA